MVTDDAWFRAVEDHFVALRGEPLILSPKDWHQASEWRRQGIPLELVLQAITDVFAAAAARGRRTPVQSLRYCRHAVEEAFAQLQAGAIGRPAPAPDPGPDAVGIVRELETRVAALPLPPTAPAPVAGDLQGVSAALCSVRERLESGALDRAGAEQALAEIDQRLLGLLQEALPAEELAALHARCDRRLADFGGRLSAIEADQTRSRMLASELRRLWHLPRLSVLGGRGGG